MYEQRHTRMIADYGGIAKVVPRYAALFLIIALASMGLPMLNGFIGEFLILQGIFQVDWVYAAFAVSGIVLGAAYLLWLYQRLMFGKLDKEENRGLVDLTSRESATLVPIVVLCIFIGVYPKPFLDRLDVPVQAIVERLAPESAATAEAELLSPAERMISAERMIPAERTLPAGLAAPSPDPERMLPAAND